MSLGVQTESEQPNEAVAQQDCQLDVSCEAASCEGITADQAEFSTEPNSDHLMVDSGLSQVDSVSTELGEPDQESPVSIQEPVLSPVDDPFQEVFAEEEDLMDRYAPFVAHQNQSSLSVTSSDLSMLRPFDEQGEFLPQQSDEIPVTVYESPQDGDAVTQDAELENDAVPELNEESGEQQSSVEIHSASQDEPLAEAESEEEIYHPMFEGETTEQESQPPEYHSHLTESASTDVERQAEEILKRLEMSQPVSCETSDVEEGSESATASSSLACNDSNDASCPANAINASASSEFDEPTAALDEAQKILDEILEQKNSLAQRQGERVIDESHDAASPSVSIEYPATEASMEDDTDRSSDDREMLIVSHMEQQFEVPAVEDDSVPFPPTPVSTGRAERMDYQKLFDQLRDITKNEE